MKREIAGFVAGALVCFAGAELIKPLKAAQSSSAADYSGTLTTAGTAIVLFASGVPFQGFEVVNPAASGDCWLSLFTTAVANGAGSIRLAANGGSYISNVKLTPGHTVSFVCSGTAAPYTATAF